MRRHSRHALLPMALVIGAITLLVSAPIVEASPRSRVRSGNSISIRTGNSSRSYTPSHSSHRSHSSHSYGNRHHNTRHYGNSHTKSHYGSGVSIRIGGSYSSGSYRYGYSNRRHYPSYRTTYPTYTYPTYTYNNYSYNSNCGTPVYRTNSGYTNNSYDRSPSYGTVYTTSADRYRDWQQTGELRRTETVVERPRETLLPRTRTISQSDLPAYEREIQEAARLIRQDRQELSAPTEELSEPPMGGGSTPTSGDDEFQATEPDELARAWQALLDGDIATSRALFADAARVMPKKGEARLGYVIASLRDGDRRAASVSMVRLLESEPQLVRGGALPESQLLIREIQRQSETLKAYRDDSVTTVENRMLIAFAALLQGDTAGGQEAMRRARSAGAEGIAARNLWRLVGLSDKPLERLSGH